MKHPDETPTQKQRRVWDKSASSYDGQMDFVERLLGKDDRRWLGERATGRVLEVAIGTGRSLPFYTDAKTLTGVDLSPEMLAIARRRAEERGLPIELREGDAEHLPVEDATYDSVVCCLSMCSIPDPAAAIAEMKRALVPGGRLLLVDHVASTWPPIYAVQWLVERISIRVAGEHYTRRPLPLVEAAGFEIAETLRHKAGSMERVHAVKPS
ncbi:MAG TPA: methyltransferase domain-containing protein [Nocardioides sp.]|jgi:ubiquinone/menaquinone biosynthesis C-methylase UbiE|nr:methyltransferase domain-containing protein [Nocardioides sp.]